MRTHVSNQSRSSGINFGYSIGVALCRLTNLADQVRDGAFGGNDSIQLHPWLVPHSVQTPQAPARITLSLPHTEQVISIKMLPSATMTRSA